MFDESFSSALSYTSRPYAEAMAMCPTVTYTLYATSSKEKTGDVITFAQFEEGNLISETRNDTERDDEYEIESIMMSEKDMDLRGIPQHQKGYLVYVTSTRKVILSYGVMFDESFSSALSYMSRPYAEAMAMCPMVKSVCSARDSG